MFNAFTASVFTKKVRCNQAGNIINTNKKVFKIEKRKQVREIKHKVVALSHPDMMKFRDYGELSEAISEALQKLVDDEWDSGRLGKNQTSYLSILKKRKTKKLGKVCNGQTTFHF